MVEQRLVPQLVMVRADLKNLPAVELEAPYAIRSYRPGDEGGWETIIAESFGAASAPPGEFARRMKGDPAYRPERVLFVSAGAELVATASAWRETKYGPDTGVLHMVGVRPSRQGHRLGYWVSLAAMHHMAAEGAVRAILRTDDFRLAAVRTYLKLDFAPLLVDENQRQRWRTVLAKLGEDAGPYEPALTGAITLFEEK